MVVKTSNSIFFTIATKEDSAFACCQLLRYSDHLHVYKGIFARKIQFMRQMNDYIYINLKQFCQDVNIWHLVDLPIMSLLRHVIMAINKRLNYNFVMWVELLPRFTIAHIKKKITSSLFSIFDMNWKK